MMEAFIYTVKKFFHCNKKGVISAAKNSKHIVCTIDK